MSRRMNEEPLPPATPAMAKRVWNGQREPSARKVARALNQAGFQVHFTTVARWKSQGWVEHGADRLEAARANLDLAIPVLTGNPITGTDELVNLSEAKAQLEGLSENELVTADARQALITIALVQEQLNAQLPKLLKKKAAETAVLV